MGMDFYQEVIKAIKASTPSPGQLTKLKTKLAGKHRLKFIPSNFDILLRAKNPRGLRKYLLTKPTRTLSGVSVVAVMAKPRACPHGKCLMCPGGPNSAFGDVPQSYTGKEPATLRAIRNKFDPFFQVFNRLEQYVVLGHPVDKVELIIMGGTFPAYPKSYQDWFVMRAFQALNEFSSLFVSQKGLNMERFKTFFELPGPLGDKARKKSVYRKFSKLKVRTTLLREQQRNETSHVRLVALAIETRPDCCKPRHVKQMLRLGCTRVELGVQSLDEEALSHIQRGHGVKEVVEATKLLREAFLKVGYHIMPGLPGVSTTRELEVFKTLFSDPRFRPDFIKLYPLLVLKGTRLYELWQAGEYTPMDLEAAKQLLKQLKPYVPEYTRIMRVQRDIPDHVIASGPKCSNLRQLIQAEKVQCRCIRCREYGTRKKQGIKGQLKLVGIKSIVYEAAGGSEYFIQAMDPKTDTLFGFCRLRIAPLLHAGIRELHVYGGQAGLGQQGEVQHKGLGMRLLKTAEDFARVEGAHQLKVISGIGAREYYRKLGYKLNGHYMVKAL
jgi:elongator complex protein 3